MNRIYSSQLLVSVTIALLSIFSTNALSVDFTLPEEVVVHVNGREVKGFQGDPDYLTKLAENAVSDPDSERAKNLPKEGFVFHPKYGAEDGFEIVAWSSNGEMKAILKVAREKLLQVIHAQADGSENLAGYRYTKAEQTDFESVTVDVLDGKILQRAPAKKNHWRPNIQLPSRRDVAKNGREKNKLLAQNPLVYTAAITASPQAVDSQSGFDWKLILILLAIFILLLVCTRAAFLIKV